jgi:putative hemolysin
MPDARPSEIVSSRFTVALARHGDEVAEAQRLRWRVFAGEQGAHLPSPIAGLDIDPYDSLCEHLLVRERANGAVVGTYRLLPGTATRRNGFYSEQEFDLAPLRLDRDRTLEIGRSCVAQDYRDGAVIAMLWAGLAAFIENGRYDSLIGCASIGAEDGGHRAASIYAGLDASHVSPPHRRVVPHHPLPLAQLDARRDAVPPPLVKGYLRSGAIVCGAPAYDAAFGTADLLMLLDVPLLSARYARHFRRPALERVAA